LAHLHCLFRDLFLLMPRSLEVVLYLLAGHNFGNIQSLDEFSLCPFCKFQLDFERNILILQDGGVGAFVMVERKPSTVDELVDPVVNFSCMVGTLSLCLCDNY